MLIRPQFSNAWLLAASLFFYFIEAQNYIYLLFLIIGIDYFSGLILGKVSNVKIRKVTVFVSVASMIAIMTYYKYYDFVVKNLNYYFHTDIATRDIILPIGISFFVFQAISYLVDIYRGEDYLRNPIDMALYISFFPQLIAGPIVRFHDIREYLCKANRNITFDSFSSGLWRFSVGLCKKVLIANNLGSLADIVFNVSNIYEHSILYTWLGAIAYTLQIYYDFSGYSDMAIGLGYIFGFRFYENFNDPYISSSIKEFWRRWHMSLSYFFRDYVYIPLGGNRCSKQRRMVNVMVVWLLTGIWHGASWTYISWGVGYGIIVLVETFLLKYIDIENKYIKAFMHIYTMVVVASLWVIFRSKNLHQAYHYLKNMFGLGSKIMIDAGFVYQFRNYFVLLMAAVIISTPILPRLKESNRGGLYGVVSTVCLFIGVIASVSFIWMGSYNPFLYFIF